MWSHSSQLGLASPTSQELLPWESQYSPCVSPHLAHQLLHHQHGRLLNDWRIQVRRLRQLYFLYGFHRFVIHISGMVLTKDFFLICRYKGPFGKIASDLL